MDDPNHPIIEPTAKITPQYKDGKVKADKKVSKKIQSWEKKLNTAFHLVIR